jgi:hypothetical protein
MLAYCQHSPLRSEPPAGQSPAPAAVAPGARIVEALGQRHRLVAAAGERRHPTDLLAGDEIVGDSSEILPAALLISADNALMFLVADDAGLLWRVRVDAGEVVPVAEVEGQYEVAVLVVVIAVRVLLAEILAVLLRYVESSDGARIGARRRIRLRGAVLAAIDEPRPPSRQAAMKMSTIAGSNCEPAHRCSSSSASAAGRALR